MTQKTPDQSNRGSGTDPGNPPQSQDNIAQSPDDLVDPAKSRKADKSSNAGKPQDR
ncbi:hypothetical protein [Paracoccus sp. SSK6]|uniref:hypothetical protein n=1 Tax=Paracoccus sp. SSK6 TaxID=3143131 RepID=UPI0032194557